MTKIEDFSPLINELIMDCAANNTELSERALEIINKIADYAEGTELFKLQLEKGVMFDGASPKQIYGLMLNRMKNSLTTYSRDASCVLIMPFLRRALQMRGNKMEDIK